MRQPHLRGGRRTRAINTEALRKPLAGCCFTCEMLAANPEFPHHLI